MRARRCRGPPAARTFASNREPLQREGRADTISQQVLEALKIAGTSRSLSEIHALASIENPLSSQARMSAAGAASSRRVSLNQRITWRRTRSVSTARWT